jgi:hypothetical protein
MSRTFHHGERRISVHGVRRDSPDLRRIARALIDLAQAQAEAEAQAANPAPREDVSKIAAAERERGVRPRKDAA